MAVPLGLEGVVRSLVQKNKLRKFKTVKKQREGRSATYEYFKFTAKHGARCDDYTLVLILTTNNGEKNPSFVEVERYKTGHRDQLYSFGMQTERLSARREVYILHDLFLSEREFYRELNKRINPLY